MNDKEIYEKFQNEVKKIEKKKDMAEITIQVEQKNLAEKCKELLDLTNQKDIPSAINYLNECKEKLKSVEEDLYSEIEEFLKKVEEL